MRGRCALPRLDVAAAARKLAEMQRRASRATSAPKAIARRERRRKRSERLARSDDALARQVRMSYMTGREEIFKLLLSQENSASLGRMLVYYDYFNRARTERIGAVSAEIAKLAELGAASDAAARGPR